MDAFALPQRTPGKKAGKKDGASSSSSQGTPATSAKKKKGGKVKAAPQQDRQRVVSRSQQRGHVERIVGHAPLKLGDTPKRVVGVAKHVAIQGGEMVPEPRDETRAALDLSAGW